ncbi:unnamed protein product [Ixodes pacificus]
MVSAVPPSFSVIRAHLVVDSIPWKPSTFHFSRVTSRTLPYGSNPLRTTSSGTSYGIQWRRSRTSVMLGSTTRHRRPFTCSSLASTSRLFASAVRRVAIQT